MDLTFEGLRSRKLQEERDMRIEDSVILHASKTSISEQDKDFIRNGMTEGLDWGRFLYLCVHHRVTPLVVRTLQAVELFSIIENNVRRAMMNEVNGIAEYNRFFLAKIDEVNNALLNSGVKAILIKGVLLAPMIYRDIALRQFSDADYLISEQHLDRTAKTLLELGYIQGTYDFNRHTIVPAPKQERIKRRMYTHELVEFIKLSDNKFCPVLTVDINFSIFWKAHDNNRLHFDVEQMMQYCELVDVGNSKIYSLLPEYQLIQLCAHLYNEAVFFLWKSNWIKNVSDLNLIKFCDLNELIHAKQINWDLLAEIVESNRIQEPVYYALLGVNLLFGEVAPAVFLQRLNQDPNILDDFFDRKGKKICWSTSFIDRLFSLEAKKTEIKERGLI